MTVSTISTSKTITPKNSENQSRPRKTNDAALRSRLRPVETAFWIASRELSGSRVVVISRPA